MSESLGEDMKAIIALCDHLKLILMCEDSQGNVTPVDENSFTRHSECDYIYTIVKL